MYNRSVVRWPVDLRAGARTPSLFTSKLSQYRSLEQSYTVLTHGLHARAWGTVPCRKLSIRVSSQTPSFYTFRARGLTWLAITGQSSIVYGHGLHPQALLLRQSPLKRTLASAYPPKPLLFTLLGQGLDCEQSLWAKFHRIWAWFAPPPSFWGTTLASAYPPKPLLFTLLGVGA